MGRQKCDGSGVIVYYDPCQERFRHTTCPSCGGVGCSDNYDKVTDAVASGIKVAIPVITIAALLAALYLKHKF